MGRFPKLGTLFNRDFRNSYNQGVDKIDAELDAQINRVDNLIANAPQPSEVVDARGGEAVLGNRLNNFDTQLAQKALQTDLNTTNENVTDLQNFKLDKTGIVTMANIGQDVKEAMTGGSVAVVGRDAVLAENIVDGQVLPIKTSFLEIGKNKFDGNFLQNVAITTENEDLSTMKVVSSVGGIAALIPITPSVTYTISLLDTYNRFRVGIMNSLPTITSTPLAVDTPLYDYAAYGMISTYTFTNTALGKYLLVYLSNQNERPRMQVEIGNQVTSYEPFTYKFKSPSPKSVSEVMLDDNTKTKVNNGESSFQSMKDLLIPINKFNGVYDSGAITTYIDKPTCDFVALESGKVAIVKVDKDTQYSVKILGAANRFKIAGYKGTDKPVPPITGLDVIMYNDTMVDKKHTFNSGSYEWIIVYVSNQNETPNMNFNIGDISETFIDYNTRRLVIGKDNIAPDVLNGQQASDGARYFLLDDITGIYEKPTGLASVASGQGFVLETSSHTSIYAIYDDLVTRFPNYVSRILLGNEVTGKPIYQYTFKTPDIDNQSTYPYKKLKILLTSAIHGYEQGSAWCLAQFFKDLCDNYTTKSQLEFMRWNVDFVVVPVVNPWGYDNNQRKNSNGIDLNRNFPANWSLSGNPTDEYYGGASAASELETQYLMGVIDANTDAELYIDYHNIASGYPLFYLYDNKASTIAFNAFKTLTRKWKNDYPSAPQDGTMFGYVRTGINACSAKYSIEKGLKSFVFETPWQMPFGSAKYDKTTIETGVEAFGNTLVTVFKSLK